MSQARDVPRTKGCGLNSPGETVQDIRFEKEQTRMWRLARYLICNRQG